MQTTEQALFKNLPEPSKAEKSGFNFQTSAIDQWYDTLPMANIRVSSKSIYQALKETNSVKIAYKKRLYFLEKVHESVIELACNLKRINLNRELPLDEKHQQISVLLHKLHYQIAIGYKIVLQELMNCQVFFLCPSKNKLMALVIERLIRHNSMSLIASYQFYDTPREDIWSDIHHLFLLAHNENLLDRKVSDPSLQLVKEISIKNVYMQILLTAVANPYRMTQQNIFSIFNQLENWSELADLHKFSDSDSNDCLVINLSQDTHPAFISPQDMPDKSSAWTIDTSKLDYAQLIEHYKNAENQTSEVKTDLLKQLSLAWGIAPRRQQSRRPIQSKLKVAIGLGNVHYVLNGFAEPDWTQIESKENSNNMVLSENSQPSANFSTHTVPSTVKVNDIWGEVFTSKTLLGEKPESLKTSEPVQQQQDPHEPKEWDMVNESIGGYCLLWDHIDSVNAKVGEIIAINYEQGKKENSWFVGTIRWMKSMGNNKIQIGTQILAPNAMAVSISKYASMHEGIKTRAIMLPAIPILKQPKTLITTGLGFNIQDQVMLDEYRLINAHLHSVESKIILMETLEVSSHFSRFKYSLAEEVYGTSSKTPVKQNNNDTLSLDGDTDFDSIWDDL